MSELCGEIFKQNVLFVKHEEIIKRLRFIENFNEDLMINYHNISRYEKGNCNDDSKNSIQYWIYLMVRDFEKKVVFYFIKK